MTAHAIAITPGAEQAFMGAGESPDHYLRRHAAGDWGIMDAEDKLMNDRALKWGFSLYSVYELSDSTTIWIITGDDRSVTTILLPDEY